MAKRKLKKRKEKTLSRKRRSTALDAAINEDINAKLKKVCDKFYAESQILKDELRISLNNPNAEVVRNLLVEQSASIGLSFGYKNNAHKDFETNVNIPKLHSNKLEKMIKQLKNTKKKPVYVNSIVNCSSSMNSAVLNYWQSPTTILKAVNDCILRRKWDNLIRLLLILIQHSQIYRPIIRHACQIMDQMYPLIEEVGLKNHFNMIKKLSGRSDD